VDAVPTLKGGSTIGIPSPPAIHFPDGFIGVPEIRDVERLQGFEAEWTAPAIEKGRHKGARWKLAGNAVSTPVARWVGERLLDQRPYDGRADTEMAVGDSWPKAAWGEGGRVWRADLSAWPTRASYRHLTDFLEYDVSPLSARATEGFLKRATESSLNFVPGFLDDVAAHLEAVRGDALAA
jgi:DNA (cytosine-5)-methyltransferase 1